MFKYKSIRYCLIAGLFLFHGLSNATECAKIASGVEIKFEIKANNSYFNCIVPAESDSANYLQVLAQSLGNLPFRIRFIELLANGNATPLAEHDAQAGAVGASIQPLGRQIAIVVLPTDGSTTKVRNVSFLYVKRDMISQVVVTVDNDDVAAASAGSDNPSPQVPGPGDDVPVCNSRGVCSVPASSPNDPSAYTNSEATNGTGTSPTCSTENTPPEQNNRGPKKFNINENLGRAKTAATIISYGAGAHELGRAMFMASMFAPFQPWDLKNNPTYRTSQEFGNFFYGAVAAEMGYSLPQALKAGAVVQQYQNYKAEGNPAYGDKEALIIGLLNAAISGQGDNSDDPPLIIIGFDYDKKIYQLDVNKNIVTNSCSPLIDDTMGRSSDVGEPRFNGGWTMSNFIGVGSCYGNCGRTITITTTVPVAIFTNTP